MVPGRTGKTGTESQKGSTGQAEGSTGQADPGTVFLRGLFQKGNCGSGRMLYKDDI